MLPPNAPRRLPSLVSFLALVFAVVASPIDNAQQHVLQHGHEQQQQQQQQQQQHEASAVQGTQRKLTGKFLHITDFHPDLFYKAHTSPGKNSACHRGRGTAGVYGAEITECDSPLALINATCDWIAGNIKDDIDFVVWTGDSARHDSDENHPRSTKDVLATNRILADKLAETFSDPDSGRLAVPVVPNLGNNDFLPHNIFYPGPNRWLEAYTDIWRRFIPESEFHVFAFGGWFLVEAIPGHLAVLSLNTMYLFDRNAAVDGCANPSEPGFQQMEWLRIRLQQLRERGMKAILIGHVPPARTDGKQNWDESCWQKHTLWLQQYRDVVTASLYGHMNIDHFLLHDSKDIDILGTDATAQTEALDTDEKEVSVQSKEDYLLDLRRIWSNLPLSSIEGLTDDDDDDDDDDGDDAQVTENDDVDTYRKNRENKNKKHGKKKHDKKLKKIGGKYAERYSLSLVSPSIVPNYFPTIRVFEYNITGLEDTPVWADTFGLPSSSDPPLPESEVRAEEELASPDDQRELKRDGGEEDEEETLNGDDNDDVEAEEKEKKKKKKSKKNKKKGNKGNKGKKPKQPHLIVPEDPPKGSTPGPAYFPQPLTLKGYTQYFANLTHINNVVEDLDEPLSSYSRLKSKSDTGSDSDSDPDDLSSPGKKQPSPREFKYEVEYDTYEDKLYRLKDLTVLNYLKLAYKMRESEQGQGSSDVQEEDLDDDGDDDDVNDVDVQKNKKHKKGKKKKKKKHHKKDKNKTWLHFLDHAFVRTVPKEELERM
ncbi:endopolyphosphatase [Geosmithia morbida]|uniref:Endopolyphosphatase n=1 Tax=Geosmithia morbida TaxID=1094350 RepID=A0A9P4YWT9_9HYPO|nr:endopolyphosphatase [Geosmithia morbida]KAF4122489.1 endopolyphosphatase [Geosmithia morbida]